MHMCMHGIDQSMHHYVSVIVAILAVATYANANAADNSTMSRPAKGTPEWVVEMYFRQRAFPDQQEYMTGEALRLYASEPTWGEMTKQEVQISYRILESKSVRKIYAIESYDSSLHMDIYCYLLLEEGKWKISAMRSLALSGIYWAYVQECEGNPSYADTSEVGCENARLMISSDQELKQHLLDNLDEFEEIVRLKQEMPVMDKVVRDSTGEWGVRPPNEWEKREKDLLDELFLMSVSPSGSSGEVRINVGGILDNELLYIYLPDDVEPPTMSPGDYIYVEEIAPHWYLAKRT